MALSIGITQPSNHAFLPTAVGKTRRAASRLCSNLTCSTGTSGAPILCRNAAAAPAKRNERSDSDCSAAEQANDSRSRAIPRLCWVAYASNESGQYELYVRPFPGPGGVWQVSTARGNFPRWSKKKPELFYRAADGKIMVEQYDGTGHAFRAGRPQLAVDSSFSSRAAVYTFDLHPDGQPFIVVKGTEAGSPPPIHTIKLILNLAKELQGKVTGGME
jgi:hypothetical protein